MIPGENTSIQAHRRNTAQDTFANHTPSEVKTFTNVIAAKDLGASRRVIVAACFGIGFFPSYPGNLNLAEILDPLLNSLLERLENGLKGDKVISVATHKLIFFDGEAAFNQGLDHNGLYIGCKLHLVEKWASSYINYYAKHRLLRDPSPTKFSMIERLIFSICLVYETWRGRTFNWTRRQLQKRHH